MDLVRTNNATLLCSTGAARIVEQKGAGLQLPGLPEEKSMVSVKRFVTQARGGGLLAQRTLVGLLAAALATTMLAGVSQLPAQEPTALQAAAAIESAMVDAIAATERSVVAIARVKR